MQADDCYQLGFVSKKHGLGGAVVVILDVDYPEDYTTLESVFVEINNKLVPFFIESISIKGNKAFVKFEEVDTAESAEELKGNALFLPLDALPQLEEGQFYFHEVIGYTLQDSQAGEVGSIKNILSGPQQDLFQIDANGKEVLVPIIDDLIESVDHDRKILKVSLPEGLLDIYL